MSENTYEVEVTYKAQITTSATANDIQEAIYNVIAIGLLDKYWTTKTGWLGDKIFAQLKNIEIWEE